MGFTCDLGNAKASFKTPSILYLIRKRSSSGSAWISDPFNVKHLLNIDATPEMTGSFDAVSSSPNKISLSTSESSPIFAWANLISASSFASSISSVS